jgi:predicted SnoaL-like aldol condensation-catalyzing enzyme
MNLSDHEHPRRDDGNIAERWDVADGDLVMAHSLTTFSPEDWGTTVVDILRFEHDRERQSIHHLFNTATGGAGNADHCARL